MDRNKRYVYLAVDKDRKQIKIGRTWNVRLRLRELKLEKKLELELAGYLPCRDVHQSIEVEHIWQNRARGYRGKGEWHPWQPGVVSEFLSQKGSVVCL